MTKRTKITIWGLVSALVLIATACVPPPPVGSGQPRFNWWASMTINIQYGDLSQLPGAGTCGFEDPANWRVFIDPACIAGRGDPAGTSPGTTATYTQYHEWAHVVDENVLGFMFGRGTPVAFKGGLYWGDRERAAQCIGEAVLGWTLVPNLPPDQIDLIGYWDCPAGHVDYALRKLREAGIA